MRVGILTVSLRADWVHSLKEKRMVVRSLCDRVRNRFNVSIAEVEAQDLHQRIVLGIACVAGDAAQIDSILDHVLNFMEGASDAVVDGESREVY